MKTMQSHYSRISRLGACAVATLGLFLGLGATKAAAAGSPIVSLLIGNQDFGPGNTVDVKSVRSLTLSTSYKYSVEGTCVGTGGLSKIKSGTPIAAVFQNLKLSGVYANNNSSPEFSVFGGTYTGSQTIKGFGKVTVSAKVEGGRLQSGLVFFKITNVKVTAASPVPPGTIRFEKGARIVISAAPVIQFKATAKNVSEADGTLDVIISKFGNGKVSVTLNTVPGTADSGDFVPITNMVVNFPKATSSVTVPVTILPNTVKDGFRRFTLTLSSPTGGAVLGSKKVQTVNILDDD